MFDRLASLVLGLGTPKDKLTSIGHALDLLSPADLSAAYRGNWLARKIIRIPVQDMTRAGRIWEADEVGVAAFEAEEDRLQVWPKLRKALRLARLYGGAALIVGVDGDDPKEPLRPETVQKGKLSFVHAVSRHEIAADGLETDPMLVGFGEPKGYSLNGLAIHPSRVIAFTGEEIDDTAQRVDAWGDSVLQAVNEAVIHAGLTSAGLAHMVAEAKLDVFRIKGLTQNVGSDQYRERLLQRFGLANTAKSLQNALILDAEEEYTQKQISFASLPDVARHFLQVAAGAADIPATRLLGQSPGGLNATGESDIRNYYDRIASDQEEYLRPKLDRLDALLWRAATGTMPADAYFRFASLWQMTEAQKAEVAKTKAEATKIYVETGMVPSDALAKGVQAQLVEDGTYPGLAAALESEGGPVRAIGAQTLTALIGAWQGGALTPEDLYSHLRATGQTVAPTYEAWLDAIETGGQSSIGAPVEARPTRDAAPRSLYVSRRVANAAEIIAWAKGQGFESIIDADDLHVTVAFSRAPVDWMQAGEDSARVEIPAGGARLVEPLGEKGAVVLMFSSLSLAWRHGRLREIGASWDHPEYQPHITITYRKPDGMDLSKVEPYRGRIVLGPERFEEVDEDWAEKVRETA